MIHFGFCSEEVGVHFCNVVVLLRQCTVTVMMVTSSPIRTYMDNRHKMRVSHEEDRSDPKDLCSLGVVDLDL